MATIGSVREITPPLCSEWTIRFFQEIWYLAPHLKVPLTGGMKTNMVCLVVIGLSCGMQSATSLWPETTVLWRNVNLRLQPCFCSSLASASYSADTTRVENHILVIIYQYNFNSIFFLSARCFVYLDNSNKPLTSCNQSVGKSHSIYCCGRFHMDCHHLLWWRGNIFSAWLIKALQKICSSRLYVTICGTSRLQNENSSSHARWDMS